MDVLLHNPIANMPGPEFLIFYGVIAFGVLVIAKLMLRPGDPTHHMKTPPVPTNPDPYRIAFLRGGVNEALRLAVYNLHRQGYLQTGDPDKKGADQTLRATDGSQPAGKLNPFEQLIRDRTRSSTYPSELFKQVRSTEIDALKEAYETQLLDEHLILNPKPFAEAFRIRLIATAILMGLAVYKIAIALSNGHRNVGFLIAMAAISLIILFVGGYKRRISDLGRRYILQMQKAFGDDRQRAAAMANDPNSDLSLITVGVLGLAVLDGTEMAALPTLFQRANAASASMAGCGGFGLGSSGCGSSGCGGGGGGCGGGGCGGCGGG